MNKKPAAARGAGRPAGAPGGWRERLRGVWRILWRSALALLALLLLLIIVLRFAPVPITTVMARYAVQSVFRADAPPLRYDWVDLNDMSPQLPLAVIAAEDQLFAEHWGFDLKSIGRAFDHNSKSRRIRGASTITQQTAKNLFLWTERNWLRKGLEAGITVLLEVAWPKRRILEVYLNVAQFGDGVYGVGAACEHLLRVKPERVTASQAARLAAVLPSPRRYDAAAPGPYVRERAAWIRGQMARLGGPAFLGELAP